MKAFGVPSRVKDLALLKSAVAEAQSIYMERRGDLFDVAAAYAYHIAQNQPFVAGSKGTALLTALTLLKINGRDWQFEEAAMFDAFNALVEKRIEITDFATILRTATGADQEPPPDERREFRHHHRHRH